MSFILVDNAIEYFTILLLNMLSLSQLGLASGSEEGQFVHLLPNLLDVTLVVGIQGWVKGQADCCGLQGVFPEGHSMIKVRGLRRYNRRIKVLSCCGCYHHLLWGCYLSVGRLFLLNA